MQNINIGGNEHDDTFVNYHYYTIMLHMYEVFKIIIDKIGKEPLCNGKANRAPHIGKKCFILCWRCTSLIFTMLLCVCLCSIFKGSMCMEFRIYDIIYAIILILPTLIDGVLQYVFHVESTNVRRALLGIISGIGLWMLASWMNVYISTIIR